MDSFDALNICSVEQECSQVLPSLPSLNQTPSDFLELQCHIKQSLIFVAKYFIAFQQIMLDQQMHEGDNQYIGGFNNVLKHLDLLTFHLRDAAKDCGATYNDFVLRDFLDKMYIRTSEIHRDMRGFMVLRETIYGMKYIQDTMGGVIGNLVSREGMGEGE